VPPPSRTPSGIQSEHLFYRGQFLVLVEGGDDISFWSEIFPKYVGEYTAHFKPVGGRPELQKYINEFDRDGGRSIVAMDSDLDTVRGTTQRHKRVVHTRAYSIENLALCSCRIASYLQQISQVSLSPIVAVTAWLAEYDRAARWLMASEIILLETNKSLPEGGVHAARFRVEKSTALSLEHIKTYVRFLGLRLKDVARKIKQVENFPSRKYYRGHFLFQAVSHLMHVEASKARNRAVTISNDALLAALAPCDRKCGNCRGDLKNLRRRAARAVSQLVLDS